MSQPIKDSSALSVTSTLAARNRALDGLRGVAALVVVFHHLLLTNKWYADRIYQLPSTLPIRPWVSPRTLVEYSPLHLTYAGIEAVMTFFVLSGFVLVPSVRRYGAHAYAVGRLLRLYIPIVGAAVLAAIWAGLYVGNHAHFASWWLNGHVPSVRPTDVASSVWLLDGTGALNSALWSMRYEVMFSLVLPALLWRFAETPQRLRPYGRMALLLGLTGLGASLHFGILEYLPVFFLGVALREIPVALRFRGALALLGASVLTLSWTLAGFGLTLGASLLPVSQAIGAVLLVQACRSGGVLAASLSTPIPQYLGRLSYSLYLVHSPLIFLVWLRVGTVRGATSELWHGALLLVAALVVADLFHRTVERSALRVSARTRRHLQRSALAVDQ